MKKLFKYLIYPSLILFLAGCTDLEEVLVGDVTQDISIAGISTDGPNDVLGGVYGKLRDGTAGHGSYYSIQEITTDEMVIGAKGGDWFDGGILIALHQHTYESTHGFINNAWTGAYGAINECNTILADGDLDTTQRAQVQALRAYFYLRLCDLFGNVKIIRTSGEDELQSTRAEVFAFIETELLAALDIPMIEATMDLSASPLGTEVNAYRINTFGALGILSKLYLNAEAYIGTPMYAEAEITASYIIDNGPYMLCGDGCAVSNLGRRPDVAADPENLEGYSAVFAPNNEGNPENIFTVLFDEVSGGGMNFSQMNLHYSSQFTWNFDQQPWNGYSTLEEFYNSYEDGDVRKEANFIAGPQTGFDGLPILDYAADDEDIQLNYTPSLNELVPNYQRQAGARPGKFSFKQFGLADMDNDYPIIRLGEIYLIRGEARARANGNSWMMALDDVNVIRNRAKVDPLTSLDADSFFDERGREMFQESARRTDMIRFGKYNDAWWEKPVSDAHVNIFPIPQAQIDAADAAFPLSQNPGY